MNAKRTDFNMPLNHIVITKSWLLGFIEGDGSFSLVRATIEPNFTIKLTEKQLPGLVKIKKYLQDNLAFDLYCMHKLKCSPVISIKPEKAINNSKSLVAFAIKNVDVLNNYLIPFLSDNTVKFITKKGKDFIDFKIICKTVYDGAHYRK